ncbi:DUF4255 domain-containing protein [Serratia marcescens]|uniref:Pvc16 family protein n=1 Tax=Serratia marcescens TaxID=615 RepID=UPI0028813220|nr:Pvc16 family protein [Serratia marcescens]MDT0228796.1 DUF4255 domain-containing protein [Serratia marcescens]
MSGNELKARCDDQLIRLNQQIEAALKQYLPDEFSEQEDSVRFDMVHRDALPDKPTICVFLYDIQEDLQLRHGQSRHYQPVDGSLAHRQVHVRCSYLLSYWEKADKSHSGKADGQEITVINMALNALLNMQLPSAFMRILAASEHLSGIGNFWQSVGEKPHLCLNFTVTIPIQLGLDNSESVSPVVRTDVATAETFWEQEALALQFKRALVTEVMARCDNSIDRSVARAQLARLQVACSCYDEQGKLRKKPLIQASGLMDAALYPIVKGIDLTTLGNQPVDLEFSNLQKVDIKPPPA